MSLLRWRIRSLRFFYLEGTALHRRGQFFRFPTKYFADEVPTL